MVDLLEVPGAGGDRDGEAGEVEESKAEDGVPGEGVADAAVEGVGLVFVEAEDVGTGLGAGKASAKGGDAGCDENEREPDEIAAVHAVSEEAEGEGAGSQEEDPYPNGPVGCAVEGRVASAKLALTGELYFSAVAHRAEFRRDAGVRQCGSLVRAAGGIRERLSCGCVVVGLEAARTSFHVYSAVGFAEGLGEFW